MPAKKKRRASKVDAQNIYRIRVTLRYIEPKIWREFVLPDNYTLGDLHRVLFRVMGWGGYHLHSFHFGSGFKKTYYSTEEMADQSTAMQDEESVMLRDIIGRKGKTFTYEYDFGDSWLHEVRVMEILPFDAKIASPTCLGGARACPPEDCGSFPGYEQLVQALRSPRSRADKELVEWAGAFDPEKFSVESTNVRLKAELLFT
jgi:hypothetical protein